MKKKSIDEAISEGILDPDNPHHQGIIRGIGMFARQAGIHPTWVYQSVFDFVGKREQGYLAGINLHAINNQKYGAYFTSASSQVLDRMHAMAGFLIRNCINTKVVGPKELVTSVDKGIYPPETVLFIDSFFTAADVDQLDKRKFSNLTDVVTTRAAEGKQTVVYVENMSVLKIQYPSLGKFFEESFFNLSPVH